MPAKRYTPDKGVVRHWKRVLRTMAPIPGLCRPTVVGSESAVAATYRVEGRLRAAESHCGFQYTLAGEGRFRDARREWVVGPGTGFLCRICDPAISYYYPPQASEPWRFLWVSMEGGPISEVVAGMVERYGPVYRLPAGHAALKRLLAQSEESAPEVEITAAAGAKLVNDLLVALLQRAERQRAGNRQGELARRACAFVQTHLDENLTVVGVARELGISRIHLSNTFKAETGMTLHEYIKRRKIARACHLLKHTSMNHEEISRALGYSSCAHFCRVFRGMLRMTPRRFRSKGTMPDL